MASLTISINTFSEHTRSQYLTQILYILLPYHVAKYNRVEPRQHT